MFTGRCECGSVRYEVDGEISDFSHCHCSQCRRLHGAAFASFADVARSDFRYLSGQTELTTYSSSDTNDRVFCRICGSNILVQSSHDPESFYVAMGTVEGNPALPPGYHIFVGSKAPWYDFDDQSPRYVTEPDED